MQDQEFSIAPASTHDIACKPLPCVFAPLGLLPPLLVSALCSGLAGMLGVAYFGSAQQNQFDNYLLDAISAVVVGGTSLFGGQGGIGNTIVGLLVLGVLNNGLDHVRMDSFLKILIRGLVLLLALVVNVYAQRLRTQYRSAA